MAWKFLLLVALTLTAGAGAVADDAKAKGAAKKEAKDDYHKALTILTRDCAGCHQAADHPGALFLNRASLSERDTMDLVINVIETKQMPPAHRNFKNSKDGKELLAWLKAERAKLPKK